MNAGRDDSCLCGSGQKFTKCCGVVRSSSGRSEMSVVFQSNMRQQYSGALGKVREDAVLCYTEEKKIAIREVEADQITRAMADGEQISCQKGCACCCYFFVDATIQECEAIAYYLFTHQDVLEVFIKNYQLWRLKAKGVDKNFDELAQSVNREDFISRLKSALRAYHALNIPCPFLSENVCAIHEVRPWVCVGVVAVTPAAWCNPGDPDYLHVKYISSEVLLAKEPAFSKPTKIRSVESTMPATVFSLLASGVQPF